MNMRLLALLATIFLLAIFESSARSAGGGGHGAAGAGHGSGESSWGYSYEHNKEPIIEEEPEEIPSEMDFSNDNLDNDTIQKLIRLVENKKDTSSGFDEYTLSGAGTNEIIRTVGAGSDQQRNAALVKTIKDHERATTKIAGAKVAAHQAYRKAGCSLPKLNNATDDGLSKECKRLKREFNKQSTLLNSYQDELKRLRNL